MDKRQKANLIFALIFTGSAAILAIVSIGLYVADDTKMAVLLWLVSVFLWVTGFAQIIRVQGD